MASSSFFQVLMLVAFGAAMARRYIPYNGTKCFEFSRQCDDAYVCGVRKCRVQQECNGRTSWGGSMRYFKRVHLSDCRPFSCENNGTLSATIKDYFERVGPKSLCQIPVLHCACPPGFTGRCCQKPSPLTNPCAATLCASDSICVVIDGCAVCKQKDEPTSSSETEDPTELSEGSATVDEQSPELVPSADYTVAPDTTDDDELVIEID